MKSKAIIFAILWIGSVLFREYKIFANIDELLAIYILIVGFFNGALRNKSFWLVGAYTIFQVLYSLFLSYNSHIAVLLDALMLMRPYLLVVLIGSGAFRISRYEQKKILPFFNALLYFLLINTILTFLVGRGFYAHEQSFMIYNVNFSLALSIVVTSFIILVFNEAFRFKYWSFLKITIFFSLFLCVPLVMQGKYMGFVFCFFSFYFVISSFYKKGKKINKGWMFFFAIISIAALYSLAYNDLQEYFAGSETAPRRILFSTLPKALEGSLLWLGRGFASYGTPITAYHYPHLLMDYLGFSNFWGLSAEYPFYLQDLYFASYIAETGVLGVVLYVYLMIYINKPFYYLLKMKKLPGEMLYLYLAILSFVFIFSFGSGLMFGYGAFSMMALGFLRWNAIRLLRIETVKNKR